MIGVAIQGATALAASPVGKRAWAYASKYLPEVAQRAEASLGIASKGKSVDALVQSKSPATQQAVVKALLENGMPARDFIEQAELTPQEAREYAQLVTSYQVAQKNAVDARQTPHASTGDASLDRVVVNMEIQDALGMLGISSDDYAKLLRWVNSHTSDDVEKFQLDRKVRRLAYL